MQTPVLLLAMVMVLALAFGRIQRWPLLARRQAIVGEITSYDPDAGYGIVTEDGSQTEAFLHQTVVRRRHRDQIGRGDRVRYRITGGALRDQVTSLRPV